MLAASKAAMRLVSQDMAKLAALPQEKAVPHEWYFNPSNIIFIDTPPLAANLETIQELYR